MAALQTTLRLHSHINALEEALDETLLADPAHPETQKLLPLRRAIVTVRKHWFNLEAERIGMEATYPDL